MLYISETHLSSFLDRYSTHCAWFWQGKVSQCGIQLLQIEAWKALQQGTQHNVDIMSMWGRVWRIQVDSLVFPVSEIHRVHKKWRLKRRWRRGRSWNCATRHSLKHTAFLQVEATLYKLLYNRLFNMVYNA